MIKNSVQSVDHKAKHETEVNFKPENDQTNTEKEKKNHDQTNLGDGFIAPDGGWGWLVVLAAGCSNLCTFPIIQNFGLLFRDRLAALEITSSEITTICNISAALTCIVGLANGPMFRRFSYRQVAFFGASLVTIALFLTSFADSFITYMITFSILYGSGVGITASSNSLALNTYFKEKRRIATGFSWTITALGPIIAPHVITVLLAHYGVQGTVLLFSGYAMNAVAFSLLLQPVQWHVKKKDSAAVEIQNIECRHCQPSIRRNKSFFSSQYLYNADDSNATGYEIIDPGTPMLSRANDGWYSSTSDKKSNYESKLNLAAPQYLNISNSPSSVNLGSLAQESKREPQREKNHKIAECASGKTVHDIQLTNKLLASSEHVEEKSFFRINSDNGPFRKRSNTFNLENTSRKSEDYVGETKCSCLLQQKQVEAPKGAAEEPSRKLSWFQKIIIFFDLDLLKDYTYVNIMIGVTIANFAELNFTILTPFVLGDFGLTKHQTATVMSILGAMDIFCRFSIPFLAGKIGWENRTFFLFGVLGMAAGRIVLAHFHSYNMALMVACWIGFNKGLRTVFIALVIPSHVPLARLPAATGLQLLFSGIFYLVMGPVVGWIRDATDYTITLHCLNVATYITALSWGIEMLYHRRRERPLESNILKPSL